MSLTPAQKTLFTGALKSGVAAGTGVVISNMVDVTNPILSWLWFRHLLIATGFVILFTEARYWNQWANSAHPQTLQPEPVKQPDPQPPTPHP